MPELPDVEGYRRVLADNAAGREIRGVAVLDGVMLRNASPGELERAVAGRRFEAPGRHGKWLLAHAEGPVVLMHFGMTGLLEWATEGRRHVHDRLVFECEGGELRYRNMRKFGGVWLARDESEVDAVTGPLGPDAEALDADGFRRLLAGRRGGVKAALMDQRLLSGVGNLLADETLWRARIHPRTRVERLRSSRIESLHAALRGVLRESIPSGRIPSLDDWLTGARDTKDPHCPRCDTRLRRETVAGRTTYWCPRCQRAQRTKD